MLQYTFKGDAMLVVHTLPINMKMKHMVLKQVS